MPVAEEIGGGGLAPPGQDGFDVPGAKRDLFPQGEKDLGTHAERFVEALARFQRGELTIPDGLTADHRLDYRQKALGVTARTANDFGTNSSQYANALTNQAPRIELIDAILQAGAP